MEVGEADEAELEAVVSAPPPPLPPPPLPLPPPPPPLPPPEGDKGAIEEEVEDGEA